jgi:toxin-antitoxin system PIN domain toxin
VILPDVNVLIGAFRADSVHHPICKPLIDRVVAGQAQFGISPLALSAVVRITTNAQSHKKPSTPEEALAFGDDLLGQPHCQIVEPGSRHWEIFKRLCIAAGITGPRATDAWYAALAIEHGCTWISFNRDYARFPELDWRLPAL